MASKTTPCAPFHEAIAVKSTNSHEYRGECLDEYCNGSVPNGGYITSIILNVVSNHFNTTLAHLNQPHTISIHVEYIRRTNCGPAIFHVQDVKLGSEVSTLHISMVQNDRQEILAYASNMNMSHSTGLSYPTGFHLHPPTPHPANISSLAQSTSPHWISCRLQSDSFARSLSHLKFILPRAGQPRPQVIDQWITFTDPGSRFTNQSLGYVIDTFPPLLEGFRPGSPYNVNTMVEAALSGRDVDFDSASTQKLVTMWYPTLSTSIDFKKLLPPEGVEWLYVQVQARQVKDRRTDVQIVVLDGEMELVALAYQVVLVVDIGRNLERKVMGAAKGEGRTKL